MKKTCSFFFIFIIFFIFPIIALGKGYIINLDSISTDERKQLADLFGKALEPFYPSHIEEFSNIFMLREEKISGTLNILLSSFRGLKIDEIKTYRFQSRLIPNDTYVNQQYSLGLSRFFEAWDINTGSNDIIVGLVDSGIDYNHEDLHERIWVNTDEIPDNGMDDDNNGFIDDVIGWNFVSAGQDEVYPGEIPGPNNNPADFSGHGTSLCGIIGAMTDNNRGIAGASHKSSIMAVKSGYVNSEGAGILNDLDAARGIVYAVRNGACIINLSWGDIIESDIIRKAVNYAVKNNVIVISAAGNSGEEFLYFPSSMESVISVGSTAQNGNKSSFSNYSKDLDIFAYGENIKSTGIGNNYISMTGTSMSCAYATGAMVLLKSRYPGFSDNMLRGQLISTASDTGFFEPSPYTGILDAYSAMTTFPQPNIILSCYEFYKTSDPEGTILPGDDVSLIITIKNLWKPSGPLLAELSAKDTQIYLYNDQLEIDPVGNFESFSNTDYPFLINFNSSFFYGKRAKFRLKLSHNSSEHLSDFQIDFVMPYPENPGFPFPSDEAIVSSPLVIDINGNGYKEVFWGNYNGFFYGADHEGNVLDGFPLKSKAPFVSSPVYSDLEENGNYYIIFGGLDSKLYAIDRFGNHKTGFPVTLNGPVYGCTPVGNLNGDDTNYIIAATLNGLMYAINPDGMLKKGFPVEIPLVNYSSPALAGLDADSSLSIVIGGSDNGLYVFDNNGILRDGFPFFTGSYIFSSPSAGDIDNDGVNEIVFASYDSKLYAVDGCGNLKQGFPVNLGGPAFSSPTLCDIDNDNYLDIIIGSGNPSNKLWAVDHLGQIMNGFPVQSDHALSSSPSVYDIDGNGYPDIAIGSYSKEIFIINHQGIAFSGFPYPLGAEILCSPTFEDMDNDGDIDLIIGDHNGMVHVLDLQFPATSPAHNFWFTFRGNYHRTGSR